MNQTFTTTLTPVFNTIRSRLQLAEQLAPQLPPDAQPSHVRIRSKTADQFAFFQYLTEDLGFFDTVKTVQHKDKNIIFARFRNGGLFFRNCRQHINWLEFTSPRPEHEDGPDALVFKLEGAREATETRITNNPLFYLRYQALSADNIVNN